ncbi:hypothetical protein [Limosilactobacillus reuteri]|uniref:hypothetical protein n=1 Tax=Limosilactobacillus reuteri TaxID=1598 RepID=UPI001E5EA60A|nr:hypothetical protein [Limosilactobacillus reuteri]MCC4466856.1 hypothetical protein [Limosilactobacillus reuteri]MCC4472898.1 hypothetical protein [Limosilactobacillus reuteri]
MEKEILELRFRFLKQMEIISGKIDDILDHEQLDIHEMADLLRYAQTLNSLSDARSKVRE